MSHPEKSALVTAGSLLIAYAWYLTNLVAQAGSGPVAAIGYQRSALVAAAVLIVLLALSHGVLAAAGYRESSSGGVRASAVERTGRLRGGAVVIVGAVLAMVLAMVEVDHFWIANALLAALVVAELASVGWEFTHGRRSA